jgi:hypothetical protein
MPKKVTVVKRSGEGSAADRAADRRYPGLKEGSRAEEALDRRFKKAKKTSRGK